jgi:hypothetical protein
MTINIKLPDARPSLGSDELDADGDRPIAGWGTQVFNDHGQEITGITKINISIALDEIVTATVDVAVSADTGLDNIHALLGTKTLSDILELHGMSGADGDLPSTVIGTEFTHKQSKARVKVIYHDLEKESVVVQCVSHAPYSIWDKSDYLLCKICDLEP